MSSRPLASAYSFHGGELAPTLSIKRVASVGFKLVVQQSERWELVAVHVHEGLTVALEQ